jgi:hypothetical protein
MSNYAASVNAFPQLVSINHIESDFIADFPQEQVEALAKEIVRCHALVTTVMHVTSTDRRLRGLPVFKLVPGYELQLAAAKRAKELEPDRSCINAWVDMDCDHTEAFTQAKSAVKPKPTVDDVAAFRMAYDQGRRGKDTIWIYQLRDYLGWQTERFDAVLAKLRAEYKLDLHESAYNGLSPGQVEGSYTDSNGLFFTGLSWREDKTESETRPCKTSTPVKTHKTSREQAKTMVTRLQGIRKPTREQIKAELARLELLKGSASSSKQAKALKRVLGE